MMQLRRITHRLAVNAFIFTGLWFIIGAIVLWSPLPGALGIGGQMFAAWLILFFLILAVSGSLLTAAALNAAFPPQPPLPPRGRTVPARDPRAPMWPGPQQRAAAPRGNAREG